MTAQTRKRMEQELQALEVQIAAQEDDGLPGFVEGLKALLAAADEV